MQKHSPLERRYKMVMDIKTGPDTVVYVSERKAWALVGGSYTGVERVAIEQADRMAKLMGSGD